MQNVDAHVLMWSALLVTLSVMIDVTTPTSIIYHQRAGINSSRASEESNLSTERSDSQGAETNENISLTNKNRIRNVRTLLRKNRSSLLRHTPKSSRYFLQRRLLWPSKQLYWLMIMIHGFVLLVSTPHASSLLSTKKATLPPILIYS